jgi:hypothetical protein
VSYCKKHEKHYDGVSCIECFKEAAVRLRKKKILEADPNYKGPYCVCCGAGKKEPHDKTCIYVDEENK